jgi:hypothetical protein
VLRGVLRLKVDLLLDEECWGISLPIRLGPLSGTLRTPVVEEADGRRSIERWTWPPRLGVVSPAWDDEDKPVAQLLNKRGFGRLSAFFLDLDEPSDDLDSASVAAFEASDEWTERFRQWTGAVSRQYTGMMDRGLLGSEHPGGFLHLWVGDGDDMALTARPAGRIIVGRFEEYLGIEHLTWVVERTNGGMPPPPEREFLAEARNRLEEDDLRAAVVDASTAAEIVMHAELHRRLLPAGADLATRVMEGATLGRHASLLRLQTDGFSISQDLVRVRNRVLHSGTEPSAEEARRAVAVAQALVDGLAPLA